MEYRRFIIVRNSRQMQIVVDVGSYVDTVMLILLAMMKVDMRLMFVVTVVELCSVR